MCIHSFLFSVFFSLVPSSPLRLLLLLLLLSFVSRFSFATMYCARGTDERFFCIHTNLLNSNLIYWIDLSHSQTTHGHTFMFKSQEISLSLDVSFRCMQVWCAQHIANIFFCLRFVSFRLIASLRNSDHENSPAWAMTQCIPLGSNGIRWNVM